MEYYSKIFINYNCILVIKNITMMMAGLLAETCWQIYYK